MKPSHLMIDAGAHESDYDAIMATELPEATKTWEPLHHGTLVNQTVAALDHLGLETEAWGYALNPSGHKMFAAATIKMKSLAKEDWMFLLGLRNSYDKSMGAGVCFGERVFVCSNGCWHGTNNIIKVHRPGIHEELPSLLAEAFQAIPGIVALIQKRMEAYRTMTLAEYAREAMLVECVRRNIVMPAAMRTVIGEMDTPSFDYNAPNDSVLAFKGAVTHGLKNHGFPAPRRTMELQSLLDESCGLKEAA